MVKSLKDCAFPLPMNALGGSAQSFESFEGALLDVVRQKAYIVEFDRCVPCLVII